MGIFGKFLKPDVDKMERNKDFDGLINALEHSNSQVREKAALALDKLGWVPKDDAEKAYYLIAKKNWKELLYIGESAMEPLIKALNDKDWQARNVAALRLAAIGDERAIEPLTQALRDENMAVRSGASAALAFIRARKKL